MKLKIRYVAGVAALLVLLGCASDPKANQPYTIPPVTPEATYPSTHPASPFPIKKTTTPSIESTPIITPGSFCTSGFGMSKSGKLYICSRYADGRWRWRAAG